MGSDRSTKPKHTPGPWLIEREIDGDYPESPTKPEDAFPSRVGPFSHLEHDASWEVVDGAFNTARVEADVALLAAAPDLLAAALEAERVMRLSDLDEFGGSDEGVAAKEWFAARQVLEAAIAKAEGRKEAARG